MLLIYFIVIYLVMCNMKYFMLPIIIIVALNCVFYLAKYACWHILKHLTWKACYLLDGINSYVISKQNYDIPYKMKIWCRFYFGGLANYKNPPN